MTLITVEPMTIKSKIIVFLSLAVAIGSLLGFFQIKTLKADKARLELTAATAQTEAAGLRLELAANQKALIQREEQAAELAAQTEILRNELSELYQNNEPCALWADDPVPGPVLDRLRK